MNLSTIDALGTKAANMMMVSAVNYVKKTGKTVNTDLLVIALRDAAKDGIGQALDDAKEAIDAGMGAVADATFAASIALLGIKAAKVALGEQ